MGLNSRKRAIENRFISNPVGLLILFTVMVYGA
jgi:hypothetical protein